MHTCVCAKSLQSCPTLCNPMNCNLPGFSVHGILQTRILEWVAMPSSRGSPQLRDQIHVSSVSCIGGSSLSLAPPGKPRYSLKRNENICLHKDLHMNIHYSTIYNSENWKESWHPSIGEWITKFVLFIQWSTIHQWKEQNMEGGWISKTLCYIKEGRHIKSYSVWFHFYEISNKGKPIDKVS